MLLLAKPDKNFNLNNELISASFYLPSYLTVEILNGKTVKTVFTKVSTVCWAKKPHSTVNKLVIKNPLFITNPPQLSL